MASRPQTTNSPRPSPVSLAALVALGVTSALWALYQWTELVHVRAGGEAFCAVSDTVNCANVWNAPAASALHRFTGLPVAAWGLVWSLTALALPLWALTRRSADRPVDTLVAAVRVNAGVGVVASVLLAAVAWSVGALCLGCLGTYVLVGLYAGVTFLGWRSLPFTALGTGTARAGALTVVFALLLLWPGLSTPRGDAASQARDAALDAAARAAGPRGEGTAVPRAQPLPETDPTPGADAQPASPEAKAEAAAKDAPDARAEEAAPTPGREAATPPPSPAPPAAEPTPTTPAGVTLGSGEGTGSPDRDRMVAEFVRALPPDVQQALANFLAIYALGEAGPAARPRSVVGDPDASVLLEEWTDIRCPHCAQLHEDLETILHRLPEGLVAIAPRHFPLDGTCNPQMGRRGDGVSCVAAKAQICVEGKPGAFDFASRLFEAGRALSEERVYELGAPVMEAQALRGCVASPETQALLEQDIQQAMGFGIRGTPLVVVNHKQTLPDPVLLVALALSGADPSHPAFASLPAPKVELGGL